LLWLNAFIGGGIFASDSCGRGRVWVIVGAVDLIESRVASVRMERRQVPLEGGNGEWGTGVPHGLTMGYDIGWQGVPLAWHMIV